MTEEEKALNTHRLCSQGKVVLAATDAGFLGEFSGGRGIATTMQAAINKRQTENTTQGFLPRSQLTLRAHFSKPLLDVTSDRQSVAFHNKNSKIKFSSKSRYSHERTGSSETLWLCWLQKLEAGEGR